MLVSLKYNEKNFFGPMNKQLQLLKESEMARVKEIGTDTGALSARLSADVWRLSTTTTSTSAYWVSASLRWSCF
jgi:hypothetical protein